MDLDEALRIARALAHGLDPSTGKAISDERPVPESLLPHEPAGKAPSKTHRQFQNTAATRWLASHQRDREALQEMAGVFLRALSSTQPELLDEYLARRRSECEPSLRMIGADDGEGWLFVKLFWTLEYWRQRTDAEKSTNVSAE